MNQKSMDVLRIVAGLYLAYLGIKSMMTALSDRPENMVFFLIMAVVFMITGAGYAIYAIKRVWSRRNEVSEDLEETEDLEESEDSEDSKDSEELDALEENEDSENSKEEIAEDNEEDGSEEDEEE